MTLNNAELAIAINRAGLHICDQNIVLEYKQKNLNSKGLGKYNLVFPILCVLGVLLHMTAAAWFGYMMAPLGHRPLGLVFGFFPIFLILIAPFWSPNMRRLLLFLGGMWIARFVTVRLKSRSLDWSYREIVDVRSVRPDTARDAIKKLTELYPAQLQIHLDRLEDKDGLAVEGVTHFFLIRTHRESYCVHWTDEFR